MPSKIIGYSGFDYSEECYEYFENSCYIADTPQSADNLMSNSYTCMGKYRIDPVTIDQIMDDFGASCGDYAMEKKPSIDSKLWPKRIIFVSKQMRKIVTFH